MASVRRQSGDLIGDAMISIDEKKQTLVVSIAVLYFVIEIISLVGIAYPGMSTTSCAGSTIGLMAPHVFAQFLEVISDVRKCARKSTAIKTTDLAALILKFIVIAGVLAVNAYSF